MRKRGPAALHAADEELAKSTTEPILDEAVAQVIGTHGVRWSGLRGSARSYVAARLHRVGPRVSVFIAPSATDAASMQEELAVFLDDASAILSFPAWQLLPYDDVSPHPDIVGARMQTLLVLRTGRRCAVVTTWEALQHPTIGIARLEATTTRLSRGDEIAPANLAYRLTAAGYARAALVEDPGEFALRGGILDVFPLGMATPLRLDFFGDCIDQIRRFDPVSQISLRADDDPGEILIPPAREFFLLPHEIDDVSQRLAEMAAAVDLDKRSLDNVLSSLRTRGSFPYQDSVLQAVIPHNWFWDYLSTDAQVWVLDLDEGLHAASEVYREAESRYRQRLNEEKLVPRPELIYRNAGTLFQATEQFSGGRLETLTVLGDTLRTETQTHEQMHTELRSAESLAPLADRLRNWINDGYQVILSAKTSGGVQRLADLLQEYDLPLTGTRRIQLRQAGLRRGFRIARERLVWVTEEDIFGARSHQPKPARVHKDKFVAALRELKHGDYVVHIDYGVGRYRGLQVREIAGERGDFFCIEYAGGDLLYVPVYRLEGVQKYVGAEGAQPRLDKLGGQSWEKTKRRVKESVLAMAADLLQLYAARELVPGYAYAPPGHLYEEFARSFEYEETPDQEQAIRDVLADMQKPKPMDRLVCGDVGYGKTEVAMRAAFKAVEDGKQVAVLVPTTILAFQHLGTFRERFEAFPVKIEMLSRFVSPVDQKTILARLRQGQIDIVIGTHRLLQSDVGFKDLGLLVIDEEHRFGVRHKEKIKTLKKNVDVLTLTATPIPRTLHLSIIGLRDLSIIATPPRDRLAIRTYVTPFDEATVAEAIRRELHRRGQVFFIHNRIDSISVMADRLRTIVPEARLEVAHGQMREGELEAIMLRFLKGEFDVLLCTTIIESGIDVPNANTIIINRASHFGLAELYQLRGRVGRSHQRAYAYLVVDSEKELTREARQRLDVLQSFAELGSGFKVAAHDLEIRGAGDILGKNQSGHIAAVGFDLYASLLEQAVHELRGEPAVETPEPELNIHFPVFLPEDYMPDVGHRLDFYQRLSRLGSEDDAEQIRAEIIDRYGELPSEAENYLAVARIKVLLRSLAARSLDVTVERAVLRLDSATPLQPAKVVELVARSPELLRLAGEDKLVFPLAACTPSEALEHLRDALRLLVSFAKI